MTSQVGCDFTETYEFTPTLILRDCWGFFPKVVGFFPIRILVHFCAFSCIFNIFIAFPPICIFHMLHINASLFILTHSCKLHSGMMHSLAFIRIFNVAFGTKCIHVHFYASYVGCILIACCIHVHPMHKMHSCAFLVCCILYMSHCNAF